MTEPVEILLVEDNQDDVELAMHAVAKHRVENRIRVCRDGAEALEFLFGAEDDDGPTVNQPRVILLDLKLPRVDGLEVLRRIKSDERTQHIPVVMMTASNHEKDIVESYRLGVNSYIVKPVDFGQFLEAMTNIGYYWLLLNKTPDA